MTTAHRPTFNPARGGTDRNEGALSKMSQQYSARDMPSHTKLKYRQLGQAHPDEIETKDFRRVIQERESTTSKRGLSGSAHSDDSKKSRLESLNSSANVDADDPLDEIDEDLSDSEADSDDDDAELMAELERIKKERAAERAAKEQKEQEEQEQIRQDNILHGNPLLNPNDSFNFKVKRRWDDDVIFKNCARGLDERKKEPTFINDAIRSEFHKKFMEKYIK